MQTLVRQSLVASSERRRVAAGAGLEARRRAELGQFFTPPAVASFLASLFEFDGAPASALDPGAGVGSLTAAFVDRWLAEGRGPLSVTAVECDTGLQIPLRDTLGECRRSGVAAELVPGDFIAWGLERSGVVLGPHEPPGFGYVIMNPPYRKIGVDSVERRRIAGLGVDVSNLYAAFLALAVRLIADGGQLVAITPRSFANGPYFRSFRRDFVGSMALRRVHVYDARDVAFADADVLQENVIFHAVKAAPKTTVTITSSPGSGDDMLTVRNVPHDAVVHPGDPEVFVRLAVDDLAAGVADCMAQLPATLSRIGLSVATGRVVDFRVRQHLRADPGEDTVPLIYPAHFHRGRVRWPMVGGRKDNAIASNAETAPLLLPNGTYVVVKRFTSKEQRRRVVAVLVTPEDVPGPAVGFENHLNVFHDNNGPLDPVLARGLAAFLNSTLVDLHFRQWSGHTQVNATDLRSLRYPTAEALTALGSAVDVTEMAQEQLDGLVAEHVPELDRPGKVDPRMAHQRVLEAAEILQQLGLPKAQTNERSALTLLALLNLTPEKSWPDVEAPLLGITPMMEFMAEHYGKNYAPNSRETVRRHTVHQFVAAGIAVQNPDDPQRPTNSGKNVYQVPAQLVDLLRCYRTKRWSARLARWRAEVPSLVERWARERAMSMIPVTLPGGRVVSLSPGGQNPLIKAVVEEFCPRFTPGGSVLYVGDTGSKLAVYDRDELARLSRTTPTLSTTSTASCCSAATSRRPETGSAQTRCSSFTSGAGRSPRCGTSRWTWRRSAPS